MEKLQKFKKIILIDDDEPTNFYNSHIIEEADVCEEILIEDNVDDALILFNKLKGHADLDPSYILLDINLPKYTGFELVDRNTKLFKSLKEQGVKLFILSTSQNPSDLQKAEDNPLIDGFYEKPISVKILNDIRKKYF